MTQPLLALEPNEDIVRSFWESARRHVGWTGIEMIVGQRVNTALLPPAVHLADLASEASDLAEQVRTGELTESLLPLAEYEANSMDIPAAGDLLIVCDGQGVPVALVQTTEVKVQEDSRGKIVVESFRCLYPRLKKGTEKHGN